MSKKLTLKINDVFKINQAIVESLKNNENKYEFNYALSKNKRVIEKCVQDTNEEMSLINKEISRIKVQYCLKDKDKKPVIIRMSQDPSNSVYAGLEYGINPEYDDRMDEMNGNIKGLFTKEVEFEFYTIKKAHLPEKMTGTNLEALLDLIEE